MGWNGRQVIAAAGALIALVDIVLQYPPHPLAPVVLTLCGLWFVHERVRRQRALERARARVDRMVESELHERAQGEPDGERAEDAREHEHREDTYPPAARP